MCAVWHFITQYDWSKNVAYISFYQFKGVLIKFDV